MEQTEFPEQAVSSANHAVKSVVEREAYGGCKQKYTTTFTAEDHVKVGKCTAENRVTVAQKCFKQLNLSESTVHFFRKKYLNKLSTCVKAGDSSEVTKLGIVKCGCKVALGETLDGKIKHFNQRL